jgi:hypothetical protein
MDKFERKDMSASLFINGYKESDNQPDMRGEALVGNEKYKISAWEKQTSKGDLYYSISFQSQAEFEKYQGKNGGDNDQKHKANKTDGEDLPF